MVEEWPAVLDPAIARTVSYIQEHFAQELDLADIAREAGLSRTVLRQRFVQMLGDPPMRYCARWRMRIAADMLREGKENTANIAYAVGFNSEAAFNRAFKREFGQPPATWKRGALERLAYDPDPSRLFVSGTPTGVNWMTRHVGEFLNANAAVIGPARAEPSEGELRHRGGGLRDSLWLASLQRTLKSNPSSPSTSRRCAVRNSSPNIPS